MPEKVDIISEKDTELSAIVQQLWDSDISRLKPGRDYKVSFQGNSASTDHNIITNGTPLFKYVDENVFRKETFSAFISLLDNYISDTGEPEVVTPEEEAENYNFLAAVMKTSVMMLSHKYLVGKNLSPADTTDFKKQLYDIWFKLYARKGSSRPDSSGFEHVFVGETRGAHTVIGFHNWIQLYLQEKLGNVIYKSINQSSNSQKPDENKHIVTLQFSWKNGIKSKGSCFIGVSPEFEFALYTICFLTSPNKSVRLCFSGYDIQIVCHHHNQKHIGTTYPILLKYL
ncbi:poly(U)-specific endoribonuclease-B-like [Protopterus annectens]|uniref:poly(U)-specific endoribonuclease-B-like n=1 Tax=Protopterus annectens TaxID=7888 RepID=UPI001CFB92AA|nr:poly(U)-specific endoribonuclease-B-like [Protopterus annectens]